MSQELLVIEKLNPLDVFKAGGIGPILAMIEAEVSLEVPDTTTPKGRKCIASNAYKVSQSKTLLDKMGKSLADNLNAQLKPINAERKKARDELDALKDKIRQPLNAWEAEEDRKKLAAEAKAEAEKLAILVSQDQEIALLMNESYDREQAEAINIAAMEAEVAAAKAEEDRRVYEKQLQEDAANKARLDAEAKAYADKQAVELERNAAIEREATANRQRIEAEERAKAQAKMAEEARIEALNKAENDRLIAIQVEQSNQAHKADLAARELKAREDNKRHVGRVRKEAKVAFMQACGVNEDQAKSIVMAINGGNIPHVKINY